MFDKQGKFSIDVTKLKVQHSHDPVVTTHVALNSKKLNHHQEKHIFRIFLESKRKLTAQVIMSKLIERGIKIKQNQRKNV